MDLIARLDVWLSENRPEVHAALRPGATSDALDAFERRTKLTLPPLLRSLLAWRQGTPDHVLLFNRVLLSLDEIERDWAVLTEMQERGEWDQPGDTPETRIKYWSRNWIPFLSNRAGDLTCIDPGGSYTGRPGQVLDFWHDWSSRTIIAPSFETWFRAFVNSLETHTWRVDDDGNFSPPDGVEFPGIDGYPAFHEVAAQPERASWVPALGPSTSDSGSDDLDATAMREALNAAFEVVVGYVVRADRPCENPDPNLPAACGRALGQVCSACWGDADEPPGVEALSVLSRSVDELDELELHALVQLLEVHVESPSEIIAPFDARIELGAGRVTLVPEHGDSIDCPIDRAVAVENGQELRAGDVIAEGNPNLHEQLRVFGSKHVATLLADSFAEVFGGPHRAHALLARPMSVAYVRIRTIGDTPYEPDGLVLRSAFSELNAELVAKGAMPGTARETLVGLSTLAERLLQPPEGAPDETVADLAAFFDSYAGTQRQLVAELDAWTRRLVALSRTDLEAALKLLKRKIRSPKLKAERETLLTSLQEQNHARRVDKERSLVR